MLMDPRIWFSCSCLFHRTRYNNRMARWQIARLNSKLWLTTQTLFSRICSRDRAGKSRCLKASRSNDKIGMCDICRFCNGYFVDDRWHRWRIACWRFRRTASTKLTERCSQRYWKGYILGRKRKTEWMKLYFIIDRYYAYCSHMLLLAGLCLGFHCGDSSL